MIVERTYNSGLIMSILLNEDILPYITEDGAVTEDLYPNVFKEQWLSVVENNKVIGVCCLHARTSACAVAHIQILKKYRKEHSGNAGVEILKWVKNNSGYKTMVTEVPAIYGNVVSFLLSFDFVVIGNLKDSFIKNGELVDLVILSRSV